MKEYVVDEVFLRKIFLTEQDLSWYWGISKYTLQKWRSTGDGPIYYKIGGHIRYPLKYVLEYQLSRRFKSTSDRITEPERGKDEK